MDRGGESYVFYKLFVIKHWKKFLYVEEIDVHMRLKVEEKEVYGLLVVALFLGFMFAFRSGGDANPDPLTWVLAILLPFVMVFVAAFLHLAGQKATGYSLGYAVKWSLEIRGLLCAVLL